MLSVLSLGLAAPLSGLLHCGSESSDSGDAGRDAPPEATLPETSVSDTGVGEASVPDTSAPDGGEAGPLDAGDGGGLLVKRMALGGSSYALLSDGTVRSWGGNNSGELGDGTTTGRLTPVSVVGLAGPVTALTAGQNDACALLNSGAVQCWGVRPGDGAGVIRHSPVA